MFHLQTLTQHLKLINDLKNNLERELKENKEEDISKNYFMEFLKIKKEKKKNLILITKVIETKQKLE